MKINEKHLCEYAIGSSPVDKQGYLNKRGEVNTAFQRRWFVLKGNLLFYFERQSDREPVGVVILDECSVYPLDSEDAYTFQLSFTGSKSRTYVLAASSQEEMEEWLRALTCANYDYVRATVAQLQRQLDELNASSASSSSTVASRSLGVTRIVAEASVLSAAMSDSDMSRTSNMLIDLSDPHDPNSVRARNFEEMHRDFGAYILLKTGAVPAYD